MVSALGWLAVAAAIVGGAVIDLYFLGSWR